MSKTPRGSSTSTVTQRNPFREHQIELAAFIKDRDENPVTVKTIFGTWSSGKGGLGWHTEYDDPHPPVLIHSKRKYRPGL